MPKKCYGVYIRTERSLKKIIDMMNAKYNNELIIKNIDEFSCIINKERVKEVMEKIERYQNDFLYDDILKEKYF